MTYFKPEIVPGMRRDGSQYEAMNTWFDGNNVRFKLGKPESIGGWFERTLRDFSGADRDLNGVARSLFQWVSSNGDLYTIVGTTWKLYLIHTGKVYDITPLRDENFSLTLPSPKSNDYSFPIHLDPSNKTELSARSNSTFVKIKTTEGGSELPNVVGNSYVMMKDIAFADSYGDAPSPLVATDFNSGYLGSNSDDGWQLFRMGGEDYIDIGKNCGSLAPDASLYFDPSIAGANVGELGETIDATQVAFNIAETSLLSIGDIVKIESEYIRLGGSKQFLIGNSYRWTNCTRGLFGNPASHTSPIPPSTSNYIDVFETSGDISAVNQSFNLTESSTLSEQYRIGDIVEIENGNPQVNNEYIKLDGVRSSVGGSAPANTFNYSICERGFLGTAAQSYLVGSSFNVSLLEREIVISVGAAGKVWYSINPGTDTSTVPSTASGWGVGAWGEGGTPWGTPSVIPVTTETSLRYWDIQANGDDLIISPTYGEIYYLDLEAITGASDINPVINDVETRRAVKLSAHAGRNSVTSVRIPGKNGDTIFTSLSGHLISFGTEHFGGTTDDKFSPILVRWSDNDLNDKYIFDWGLRSTNTSGGFVLNSGSEIVGVIESRKEILIWTDSSMYSMKYVGPPVVFSSSLISSNVTMLSRNASVAAGNTVFFMANDSFYAYKGQLSKMECPVLNYVLDDINLSEPGKIYATSNERFSEVTWFYPSLDSFEVNKYVSFNYLEGSWLTGSFDMLPLKTTDAVSVGGKNRTSWLDGTVDDYPIASFVKSFNYSSQPLIVKTGLLDQERGYSMDYIGSQPSNMESFIESGFIPIDDGNNIFFTRKFLPDMYWTGNSPSVSDDGVLFEFSPKKYPGSRDSQLVTSSRVFEPSLTTSVVSSTNPVPSDGKYDIRGRGSSFSLKITSDTSNYGWRLGDFLLDVRPDGKRF